MNIHEALQYIETMYDKQHLEDSFSLLGEGNDALVYEFDKLAIKIPKKKEHFLFNDPLVLSKIQNKSKNFITMHSFRENEFMVVDKVKGKTLGELGIRALEQVKYFPKSMKEELKESLDISLSIGVIPGDLHLNNIVYSEEEERLKILDYGRFFFCMPKYLEMVSASYKESCKLYQSISS